MAKILLWNSLATRRRSASDTFFDNGLGVLRAHLENAGHEVLLEDWATDPFYASLAVPFLARPLRSLYGRLISRRGGGAPPPWVKAVGAATVGLQELQTRVQKRRMENQLSHLASKVVGQGLRILGIKLWYGEAFTWAKRLAEILRERAPETLVVAGGYHATLYEEEVLRHGPFDLAVRGEGELALGEILAIVERLANRPKSELLAAVASARLENVIWREGGRVVAGPKRPVQAVRKPIPTYGDAPGKVQIHVMIESLGCPWGKCNFCVHPHFYERYEPRAVTEVVDEMAAMVDQGIGIFRFAGSDTPPSFGAKISQGILDAGLSVVFGMGSRAVRNCAAGEIFARTVGQYETMLRAGLRAVFMGGETGHDRVNQEVMNKGVTRADLVATAAAIREAERNTGLKLDLVLALIYPVPLIEGVTQEEVFGANVELLREFRPDSVMVTPPGPFKHSRWHAEKDKFGFEFDEGIIRSAMEYEYVLYKPPTLWPKLDIGLQGQSFVQLLEECSRFRKTAEKMGIPTDLSDEHFLMLRAAGYRGREGAEQFKRETLLDIVSCDYRRLTEMSATINEESRRLAGISGAQTRKSSVGAGQ